MSTNEIDNKLNILANNIEQFSSDYVTKMKNLENRVDNFYTILARPESKVIDRPIEDISDYLRKGTMANLETKSLTSEDEKGGELILPQFSAKIISSLSKDSIMRRLANVQTVSSNSLEVILQRGQFAGGWVKEQGAREETESAKLERKTIMTHELYAQPKASQRLIEDAEINLQKWLMEQIVTTFTNLENDSFINGDGEKSPKGILTYEEGKIKQVKSSTEGKVIVSDLLGLINALDEQYLSKACFLMHRTTLAHLQNLQDNNGRFIWQPALEQSKLDSLFGIPVACSTHMPKIAKGSLAIVLADFKNCYTIVDRKSVRLMRDPYTEKPFVKFYATKRVGGDVVNMDAIKILKT